MALLELVAMLLTLVARLPRAALLTC